MNVSSDIVLASRSPRRLELLARIGVHPIVDPADIDETPHPGESAVAYVERLAQEKASTVAARHGVDRRVVAADTTVEVGVEILGQPVDRDDAARMLGLLSARTHKVHTGVCVIVAGEMRSTVVTTLVRFVPVTDELERWYLDTGEWQGKAGAYAIQGLGASLVDGVQGSYSSVVGLPLGPTARLLGIAAPSTLD